MATHCLKTPSYQLYQDFADKIFGVGKINIKSNNDNNVIGTLKYADDYLVFKKNFGNRLIRLRDRYSGTPFYKDLLDTVALIADEKNWEGAYAELAAYDIMSNDYLPDIIELNKTLPVADSFSGELGGKETNEDGFIKEYDLYFDVKILADTVGGILKGIIDDAIRQANQEKICDILPEYLLDDDEQDYQTNRRKLMEELRDFLIANKPSDNKGKKCFHSSILPQLAYRINWGRGINSAIGEYNPYRHAEECKHLIFKRYTKKFLKKKPFFLVLVNFPWYNGRIHSFANADEVFYRSLARRTFCEYKNLPTTMASIVNKFSGSESVYEVSRYLSGIIYLDDHIIKEDKYTCHIYTNPNAINWIRYGRSYLEQIVAGGDSRSLFDDMIHDNY